MRDFSLNWRYVLILVAASYLFASHFTESFLPRVLAEELLLYEKEQAEEILPSLEEMEEQEDFVRQALEELGFPQPETGESQP